MVQAKGGIRNRRRWDLLVAQLERYPKRVFLLLSGVLVLLVYGRSFSSPFLYDDMDQIVNNPNLASWHEFAPRFLLHPVALTTHFLGYGGMTYRPLFWLSLYVDRTLWGLNASGFHATNVALHLLNANLLFAFLRRLRMSPLSTAAISLLWLSLPVNTEVVSWISSRAYLLCTCFVLLCLLSALNQVRDGRFVWTLVCLITACCAVLSHELGIVTLPLLLLLAVGLKLPWNRALQITLGAVLAASCTVQALRSGLGVKELPVLAGLKWASLAFWEYVTLTLFPLHMSVERSTSISPHQQHPWWIAALAGLALVSAGAISLRKKSSLLVGGLVWFAVCILPFCLLRTYQGIAERFDYLASIGMVAAAVAMLSLTKIQPMRKVLMVGVGVWAAWNVARASVRVGDWSDPVRLYRSSLEATPRSPLVHYNLAFALLEDGDSAGAIEEYQRTIAIDRTYPHAFASLGDVYLKMDRYPAAQDAYRQALAQSPADTEVLLNVGAAYQGQGDAAMAEQTYQSITQLDPANSSAHVNLGVLYVTQKRSEDAMHQFAMAIDLKSKDIVPYYDLAVLFQQAGRSDLAMVLYKKVLELKPGDEDTLRNMQLMQQAR